MTAHYRSPLDLSLEALRAAETGFDRLSQFVARYVEESAALSAASSAVWKAQFFAALYDDLDAPRAIAVLWCILADASMGTGERARLIAELGSTLGLSWKPAETQQAAPEILRLLEARQQARSNREFAKADALRVELSSRGFNIEDSPDGPILHRAR